MSAYPWSSFFVGRVCESYTCSQDLFLALSSLAVPRGLCGVSEILGWQHVREVPSLLYHLSRPWGSFSAVPLFIFLPLLYF